MRVLSRRPPEMLLLASLVLFAAMLIARGVLQEKPVSLASDTRGPAPAPVELSGQAMIAQLQDRLRRNSEDSAAYAQLGLALLQHVRETADPTGYTRAEAAFTEALKRDAQSFDAVIGQGALALARHEFTAALRWGERAQTINPYSAQVYGIIGDAQVELGQYDAAVATIQKMVDTRPDLSSYSRVSYQRELHGDVAGARMAMQQAVEAGNPAAEQTHWAAVQLGHLYFSSGDFERAEATYRQVLELRPDYVYAVAGIARVQAARGEFQAAIDAYRTIATRLPLPEFAIALGELYEVAEQQEAARRQYDLVRVIQQLNAESGVDVDLELALFDIDHGADVAQALVRARAAYTQRPTVYAADVLAWALYHTHQYVEARRYSAEALRLGTRDAALHYHAGMIAHALQDRDGAGRHLKEALAINPAFSVRYASQARQLLAQLEQKQEGNHGAGSSRAGLE